MNNNDYYNVPENEPLSLSEEEIKRMPWSFNDDNNNDNNSKKRKERKKQQIE